MACCLSVVLDYVFYFFHFPKAAVYLSMVLECLLLSVLLPMLTVYLLHCCGEDARASGLLRASLGLWAAYAILLVTRPVHRRLYLCRGGKPVLPRLLYALLLLPLLAIQLINLVARQQQKIANQRASIMVLQMRPHFIYNTMTSIYCLCDQDPKLAQRVVMDFTAIASAELIPLTSELEHARAYLAVEQAQYEDSLFVEYDTPHIWFRVHRR